MSSNTPPMTPLDAAQAIIDARARGAHFEADHLSMDHAAAVAQALIDAESKITAMRQAFAEWESVRTFRNDVNSHEWLTLVAAMEGDK